MESYPTTNLRAVNLPGSIAPADGNVAPLGHAGAARGVQRRTASASADDDADNFDWLDDDQERPPAMQKRAVRTLRPWILGPTTSDWRTRTETGECAARVGAAIS